MNPGTAEHDDEPAAGSIVVVDDNPDNLRVLGGMLEQEGFRVRPALSGPIALRAVAAARPDLILLDVCMPGMDGIEVCRRLAAGATTRDIPVIFVSALDQADDKVAGLEAGGVDYIAKPFEKAEVLARVRQHVRLARTRRELSGQVREHTTRLRATERQYRKMLEETIHAIARLVEQRDPYTAGHQLHVSDISVAIGQELGWSEDRLLGLRLGAKIHDIGKVRIPAEILNRPGRLSDIEFAMIRTHCGVGDEIVSGISFPWPIAEIVSQHHERIDGSGYPLGLKGDEIVEEARVVAVADVVEAMASHRPYRASLGIERALAEIERGSGTSYQPEIVKVCCELFRSKRLSITGERL